jgi:uncharacterized protein
MEVSGLFVYPIKSCGAVRLDTMPMCSKGPLYGRRDAREGGGLLNGGEDREWMLVQPNGGFLTGRRFPKMLQIGVSFTEDHSFLQVSIPGQERMLFLPLDPTKGPLVQSSIPLADEAPELPLEVKTVRIWSVQCAGEDLGELAASFFSDYMESPVRLVRSSSRVAPRKVSDAPSEVKYTVSPQDEVSCKHKFL